MCGLAGYIGHSKRPKMSYFLMTNLFDYLDIRGIDAAGVWGTETGKNGRVIYHKEPIKSSDFIKGNFWARIKKVKTDLLLTHARATSKGGGDACDNNNNHPFVSADKRLAMIHNGTLEESYHLQRKFQILSETDSEYLLRMYEHGLNAKVGDTQQDIAHRVAGAKEIWSHIDAGAMAVAIGERHVDGSRSLMLFRNEKRPLWLADLRESLGQIFFFSSPDVWYKAVPENTKLAEVCQNAMLIELPPMQMWYFKISPEQPIVTPENIIKFKISIEDKGKKYDFKEFHPVRAEKLQEIDVITDMDKPSKNSRHQYSYDPCHSQNKTEDTKVLDTDWNINRDTSTPVAGEKSHSVLCKELIDIIRSIDVGATNICIESSITENDYSVLVESLLQIKGDLQGTLTMLG